MTSQADLDWATEMGFQREDPLRVAVIAGSVRRERVGAAVLAWLHDELAKAESMKLDVLDLAEIELPPASDLVPGGSPDRTSIAERVEVADAYVFVTPEYNHSFPASLKHAIDWHYREWMFKPAMLVSYGVVGGLLAAEQLRQVLAELHVVAVRRVVGIAEPWASLTADGTLDPSPGVRAGLETAFKELTWWGHALRIARNAHPFDG